MLKIYLARHGQNEDNAEGILNGHRDRPLSSIGIAQAKEVANKIHQANLRFDTIYTSPLIRAHQTADIISDGTELRPTVEPLLIERDFGIMTGQPHTSIVELCSPDILLTDTITYFLKPDGAETFPELMNRAGQLLDKLTSWHSDGSILLVTHGDFGKMVYAQYYQLDWQAVLRNFHFGNSELLMMSADSPAEDHHVFDIKQHNL